MRSRDIPGSRPLRLSHLPLDSNGIIAVGGAVIPGVADLLCTDVLNALDLLLHPRRLQATLKN